MNGRETILNSMKLRDDQPPIDFESELNALIIVAHPDDFHILAHRPVSSRTYFWAKMGNLFFYVTPIALALILPAAVVGSATLAQGIRFGVFHILAGIVA